MNIVSVRRQPEFLGEALDYLCLLYTSFPLLGWAGALPDWDGPVPGERPSAYIVILCDLTLGKNKMWDDGITAQTIMLGAVEKGLGGCILGNVKREDLAKTLNIDTNPVSYTHLVSVSDNQFPQLISGILIGIFIGKINGPVYRDFLPQKHSHFIRQQSHLLAVWIMSQS